MAAYKLMACPHDTVRSSSGWYRLAAYLGTHLPFELHFDLALDFSEFNERLGNGDLVFANPTDSLRLLSQGFVPIARASERYDEAILVMNAEAAPATAHALSGAAVATVASAAPTQLALYDLKQLGVTPGELKNYDSWLGVVRGLWNGEAPFGILYRDAYEDLSPQGRAMVQVITHTDVRKLFHSICASPRLVAEVPNLQPILLGMSSDPAGKEVLEDLGFTAWQVVEPAEINAMQALLNN
ncbi:MAG: phosphate/phosphite/phosphonate ABC transporter substrate-binding protein [Oscillochloris sp.]|nr:phosphate/phosphite/phosphonate ABC transporter substrate-binding protein [Oscillochloris sp.]